MLKNLLILAGFSAFAVVVLIGLNLYHNLQQSSLSDITQKRTEQIPSTFDKDTLNGLKERTPITVDLSEKINVQRDEIIPIPTGAKVQSNSNTSTPSATPVITLPRSAQP